MRKRAGDSTEGVAAGARQRSATSNKWCRVNGLTRGGDGTCPHRASCHALPESPGNGGDVAVELEGYERSANLRGGKPAPCGKRIDVHRVVAKVVQQRLFGCACSVPVIACACRRRR